MKIILPYNEILPTKKAHDAYLFQQAYYLGQKDEVTLVVGKGSYSKEALLNHYGLENFLPHNLLQIRELPIIRKNNPLHWSWNFPFFFFTQNFLKQSAKAVRGAVILTVFKQGNYHLFKKSPELKYIYEVHEVHYYPEESYDKKKVAQEALMLAQADLVVTTTEALAAILKAPPYRLQNRIVVLPLASSVSSLPLKNANKNSPCFAYVGQLYGSQGVHLLLEALVTVPEAKLKIVGGKERELFHYRNVAKALGVAERVVFTGYLPPSQLPLQLQEVDAFVAPFLPTSKMPYVAHVKLVEYICFGKPVVAPNLKVVKEHFPENRGVHLFEAGNSASLSHALRSIDLERLQGEILPLRSSYSWEQRAERYHSLIQSL